MKRLWFALLAIALCASAASDVAIAQQPPGKTQPPRGGIAPGRPMQRGDQPPDPGGYGSEGYAPRGGVSGRRPGSPDSRGMAPRGGGAYDSDGSGYGMPPRGGDEGGMMPGYGMGMPPRGSELQRLEQEDPEMHKLVQEDMNLEAAALNLANQFRAANPAEREKLRAALAVSVNKHFEVRQKRRELQLQRMEDELKRLRAAIEARHKGREEIIQKRLRDLVGDPQDLEF